MLREWVCVFTASVPIMAFMLVDAQWEQKQIYIVGFDDVIMAAACNVRRNSNMHFLRYRQVGRWHQ